MGEFEYNIYLVIIIKKGGITLALISCPNCGNQISENAIICPSCGQKFKIEGEKIQQSDYRFKSKLWIILLGISVFCIITAIYIFSSDTYQSYQEQYWEYMMEYENAIDMARENSGGLFGELLYQGYQGLAEEWKTMANNAKKHMLLYQIIGGLSLITGAICFSKGIHIMKRRRK